MTVLRGALGMAMVAGFVACGSDAETPAGPGADAGVDAAPADARAPSADASPADGGDAAPSAACDPARAPVTPVGTDNVTYATHRKTACLATKAALCAAPPAPFLEALLACDAVESGWFTEQGSVAIRVVGRAQGKCLLDVLAETEGGARVSRCELPLPLLPWAGLSQAVGGESLDQPLRGLEGQCLEVGQCNVIPGAESDCRTLDPVPPLCGGP